MRGECLKERKECFMRVQLYVSTEAKEESLLRGARVHVVSLFLFRYFCFVIFVSLCFCA